MLSTSWNRLAASTTEVRGSSPMRHVPMTWRDAGAMPSGLTSCRSRSPCGGDVVENAKSAPASFITASRTGAKWSDATSSCLCGEYVTRPAAKSPRVDDRRIEVDAIRRLRQVFCLHREREQPVADGRVAHRTVVLRPRRIRHRLHQRRSAAAVLDGAAADPRQAGVAGRGHRSRVRDHEVVVQVGDAASPFAVHREREDADGERLEVVHEVAPDEPGRVADVAIAAAVAASRTHRPRARRSAARTSPATLPAAMSRYRTPVARGPRPSSDHFGHVRLRPHLAPPGAQRAPQRRDRIALGVDGAAVAAAEAAVVARRAAVVRHRVHAGRRAVRDAAHASAAASDVRMAPNMSGPGGIGYGPLRHAANGLASASPATPIKPLGLA